MVFGKWLDALLVLSQELCTMFVPRLGQPAAGVISVSADWIGERVQRQLLSLPLSKQVTGLLAGSTYGRAALAYSTDASASQHQQSRQSGARCASNGRSLQGANWPLFSMSARAEEGEFEQRHLPLEAPLQAP